MTGGQVAVVDAQGRAVFGDTTGEPPLQATIRIHSPAAYRALLHAGRGIATAYTDGLWDADDLVAVIRIAARTMNRIDPWSAKAAVVTDPIRRLAAIHRSNRRPKSRKNVERHYDLGNDFFSLVLDETMGYSCAFYDKADMDPTDASRANLERVCRLLDLRPEDSLLEMGSGWGGLAVHAAKHFGCRVATVTISPSQRDYINKIARDAGVGDRVQVLMSDYRDVRGQWDKLVSLEMIESVGAQHIPAFVEQCGRLLRPDGLMLLQAITTTDRSFRIDRYKRTFITELIFPGGCAPSLEVILDDVARRSTLRVAAVYDITPHYPPTLRAWRERLNRNWPRIQQLGRFDERFRRLWTLYFSWCEAAFLERRVQDRQILLAGPGWRDENRLLGLDEQITLPTPSVLAETRATAVVGRV
jgi:cyclopropane-fatty-acyl-phospholipid synthase